MRKQIKLYPPNGGDFIIPQASDVDRLKARGYKEKPDSSVSDSKTSKPAKRAE